MKYESEFICSSLKSSGQLVPRILDEFVKHILLVLETMAPPNFICVSVCPAFTAYNSVTMDRILITLSRSIGS